MIALAVSSPGRTRADRAEALWLSCAAITHAMNEERAWAERYRALIWEGRAMLERPCDDEVRALVEERIRTMRDRVKLHMRLVMLGRRQIARLNAEYCASRRALRLVAS